jgi:glutamine synthetase
VTTDASRALDRLEQIAPDFLWVIYHDYLSLPHAKTVTRNRFEEVVNRGVTWAKANWNFSTDDHMLPEPFFGADSGDLVARPDPATLVPVPYRPRVAQALSDLYDDLGRPWEGDPRRRLRHQVGALRGLGLDARVAFEAEFQIVRAAPDTSGRWDPVDRGRMFTLDPIEDHWSLAERIYDTLEAMGIPVHQLAREYGPGQFELSLMPADPLTAADRYVVARQVVKALAREAGVVATFMPKPYPDRPGNGLHVHLSLWSEDGSNATGDPGNVEGLSDRGGQAVAGLLAHAAGQAGIGSPIPNSYKRLLPGSWAPAHVCWALGNRAALVRVPGRGEARRLEYRSGDASANPYLHATGLLAAIADGIASEMRPVAPVQTDLGRWSDHEAALHGVARLPTSLAAALDALERDDVLCAALGEVVVPSYLAVKRFELGTYRSAAGPDADSTEVTEWERSTYLEPL